ncbi:MAG: hypothetical protein IIW17_07875, partial [Clostridia bacterium]|nr:hypothetical protein [Clostridia bacterium]
LWEPSFPRGDGSRKLAQWISLQLGHTRVLTCHRHVIHYARAASLPSGDALLARTRIICLPFAVALS